MANNVFEKTEFYSYLSATIGSTRAARLAGIQHANAPAATNSKLVPARVAGS